MHTCKHARRHRLSGNYVACKVLRKRQVLKYDQVQSIQVHARRHNIPYQLTPIMPVHGSIFKLFELNTRSCTYIKQRGVHIPHKPCMQASIAISMMFEGPHACAHAWSAPWTPANRHAHHS